MLRRSEKPPDSGIKELEQEAAGLETGTHLVIDSSGIPVSAPRVALDKAAELWAAVRTAVEKCHPRFRVPESGWPSLGVRSEARYP